MSTGLIMTLFLLPVSAPGGQGRVDPPAQRARYSGEEEEPPGAGERGAAGEAAGLGGGQAGPAG